MQQQSSLGDEQLAERARAGDTTAFAELWRRHVNAGRAAASHFRSIADPDDIVSEAYLQLLRAFQRGGGPREAFRPYLYRTIRNVALGWRQRAHSVPIDDLDELTDPSAGPESATIQKTITVRAFRTLPERWQTVLWYTEVEGMEPAEAAPYLGLTANAAAALAYRAREGFKKAWLQAHVNDLQVPAECRWTTERMGEYARGGLTPRARARFREHLRTCTRCPILLEEIDDLGGKLAVVLLPLTLGATAGAAMLGARGNGSETTAQSSVAAAGRSGGLAGVAAASAVVLLAGGAAAIAVPMALQPEPAGSSISQPAADPPPVQQRPDPRPTQPVQAPPATDQPPPAAPAPLPPARPPLLPPVVVPVAPPPDTSAPPAPVVATPLPGALTRIAAVTVAGTGEPGARIETLRVGGALVGATTVLTDGTWSLTTAPLPDGVHSLLSSQVDAAGNRSAGVAVPVTIDTIALPPVLDALPPDADLYLPVLSGTAEPGAKVELLDTSTVVASAFADSVGRWSIQLPDPLADGHTFSARQTDMAGNASAASAPTEPLLFRRPEVVVPIEGAQVPSSGVGGTEVSVRLSGIAGMQVQILVDGVATGNIHTLEATPITRVTRALPDGTHTISVRYFDAAGGRLGSLSTRTFTIAP